MNVCECKRKCECTLVSVIASVVIGIVTVFLNFSATIAVAPAFLLALAGTSIVFLLVALLVAPKLSKADSSGCLCTAVTQFLTGILATVLFSVILLAIDLAATGLIASILVGLLIGAFTLTLTSAACIIKSVLKCDE